jgi:hypothetical protein
MSGKNRAFALAIATAALVGFVAPAASAASNPSGFNNDSILNVSRNQVPIQACNNDVPVNAGFLAGQLGLSDIAALLSLTNTGSSTTNDNRSCTQTPAQTDPTTVTTNSTSTDPSGGNNNNNGCDKCGGGSSSWSASDDSANTSGFNNDSILNVSNNQVPVQACNNDVPINAGVGVVQAVGEDLSAVGGLLGNSGNSTVNDNRNCTQTPTQDNPTDVSATSSSS